ncbi:MAG: hypothetical protein RLO12_19415 [Fulvivirga sp.]|uniref:hypothetical protein n=1 Tax=Fulvivirga sp. TaxID=1931237 RepID=UPI0032FF9B36
MKTLFYIFFIGFSIQNAFGQITERKASLALGGGIDLINNLDLATSPFSYQGLGVPVGVNMLVMSENWINRFEATFILPLLTNNYALKSNAGTELKSWSKVRFNYQLLRSIDEKAINYVGGEIKLDFFLREYQFLDGFGWELQNSFNLDYARLIHINNKSFILSQFSFPIVGFIHRKPSLTLDEGFLKDLEYGRRGDLLNYGNWKLILDEWTAFELKILYHNQLNERFSFQTQIGLNYYSISYPEKVQNVNLPLICYLNYHF